ncbi:MAG: 3-hydroxyacyl-CoA dehydrogenase NAD-binding domain-containing protein [Acetobacteraceae bacterium]
MIKTIAVVGAGLIGASWATYFLSRGLHVVGTDPAPGADARLAAFAERFGADTTHLAFTPDLAAALRDAEFVQESGPERLADKVALFRQMDAATPPEVVLASSSSTLLVSDMQAECVHPGRVVLGHPFNPPHLIPLVEVVGGRQTDEASIEAAMAFYAAIGKHPIRLNREILGHIANRLQAALWREAFHLLDTGVASAAAIDAAIAHGPGLRWALLGPFLNLHLAGGEGGIDHMLAHLGPPTEAMWDDLGAPRMDAAMRQRVSESVHAMLAATDVTQVTAERDALLTEIAQRKATGGVLP